MKRSNKVHKRELNSTYSKKDESDRLSLSLMRLLNWNYNPFWHAGYEEFDPATSESPVKCSNHRAIPSTTLLCTIQQQSTALLLCNLKPALSSWLGWEDNHGVWSLVFTNVWCAGEKVTQASDGAWKDLHRSRIVFRVQVEMWYLTACVLLLQLGHVMWCGRGFLVQEGETQPRSSPSPPPSLSPPSWVDWDGCSSVKDHFPEDQEVLGSNPFCIALDKSICVIVSDLTLTHRASPRWGVSTIGVG